MTLTVNRLHFAYQQTPILRDISFSVPRGKLVGIVGPNGCGKSTLLKLLSGQMKAQSGEILLKGKPLASYPMKGLARELAYLPQRPLVPAGIQVEQLVQYGKAGIAVIRWRRGRMSGCRCVLRLRRFGI